ncbi:MAG: ParB N-terminal domain-containing protein [Verrucomicrobia bacterium]|nr:ParB N-terminal domain-containing protein [Verrucomicrobiota bacterium]
MPADKKDLRLDELLFDSKNPRLPKRPDETDEGPIIAWMLDNADVTALMGSIGEQGYFEGEPLIVVPSTETPGKYTVVEGNRRLTAVKLLRDPALAGNTRKRSVAELAASATYKPDLLPCLVFRTREEIMHYLAYRHVTGIEAWGPREKARYLRQLAESTDFRGLNKEELRRRLAREIGSTPNYVARLLAALAVYDEIAEASFFGVHGLSEDTVSYSVLSTALTSFSNIAQYVGMVSPTDDDVSKLKKKELENLTRWLFEENAEGFTRVAESRELKTLNRVLAVNAARDRFISGRPLSEADMLTEGPAEAFRTAVNESRDRLTVARDCLHLVREHHADVGATLEEVVRLSRALFSAVNVSKDQAAEAKP